MSTSNERPPEFWEAADAFIAVANARSKDMPAGKVSAALLYAAARFNTFVMASTCADRAQFSGRKEEAVAYYVEQFEKMLRDNLDDYEQNVDSYVGENRH